MTGRERALAMLSGGQPDHLPLMPITMMFAARHAGVKYRDYARDHRVLAAAQLRTAEKATRAEFPIPNPEAATRMLDRVEAVRLLREKAGRDVLVEGWVEGPCA